MIRKRGNSRKEEEKKYRTRRAMNMMKRSYIRNKGIEEDLR